MTTLIIALLAVCSTAAAMVYLIHNRHEPPIADGISLSEIVRELGSQAGRTPFDLEPERSGFIDLIESLGAFMSLYKMALDDSNGEVEETLKALYSTIGNICRSFLNDVRGRQFNRAETAVKLSHTLTLVKTARSCITKLTLAAAMTQDGLSEDAKSAMASISSFCAENK